MKIEECSRVLKELNFDEDKNIHLINGNQLIRKTFIDCIPRMNSPCITLLIIQLKVKNYPASYKQLIKIHTG